MAVYTWKQWGARLRTILREKPLNLRELALLMPVNEATGKPFAESSIRSWLNGTREINLSDFFALCEAADVDPKVVLFGGTGADLDPAVKQELGGLLVEILDADPAAHPHYKDLIAAVRKDMKKRHRSRK